MYGSKEIKIALRKYIASTGNKTIDEQSVIDILDKGKDRDFYASSKVIKEIRQQYGVGQSIPEWLRMLTFRLIYDYLSIEYEKKIAYDSKEMEHRQETGKKNSLYKVPTQVSLLEALGFNKKVFDSTSWNMYSPEMKIRQSRFNPVDFPFTYAEVESNPIYVAIIHHLVSESRVLTDSFVDVFGKMGYVPAFCAEGYTHKLIFKDSLKEFLQYYYGITERPTKAYKVLQSYKDWLKKIYDYEKDMPEIQDNFIEENFQDYITAMMSANLYELNKDEEFYEYAIVKFCNMCFYKPYWQNRYVHGVERFIDTDFRQKVIKKFLDISKEEFISYAQALKKIGYRGEINLLLDAIIKWSVDYEDYVDSDLDINFAAGIEEVLLENIGRCTPLLYLDAPKQSEYQRFNFDSEIYMKMLRFLINYKGNWILTMKNYNSDEDSDFEDYSVEIKKESTEVKDSSSNNMGRDKSKDAGNKDQDKSKEADDKKKEQMYMGETYALKDFRDMLKTSEQPLYEYIYSSADRNVRTGISFISNIDCDDFTQQYFKSRYDLNLKTGDKFTKQRFV